MSEEIKDDIGLNDNDIVWESKKKKYADYTFIELGGHN